MDRIVPDALLEIRTYVGEGYTPLVAFGAWRVAILRFIDDLQPHQLDRMQRHDETDEVFVLLAGRCILFLGEGDNEIVRIHAQEIMPHTIYNVKRSVWHTHALSEDATVLVIENRDTSDHNSLFVALSSKQQQAIVQISERLWG